MVMTITIWWLVVLAALPHADAKVLLLVEADWLFTGHRRCHVDSALSLSSLRHQLQLQLQLPPADLRTAELQYFDSSVLDYRPFHDPPRLGRATRVRLLSTRPGQVIGLLPGRRWSDVDLGGDGLRLGNVTLLIAGSDEKTGAHHSEATGLQLWDGAVVLAKYMEHVEQSRAAGDSLVSGRTVIELGCGTGLAGLAALSLGAATVIMTDMPLALTNTHANLLRNSPSLNLNGAGEGRAAVEALDWTNSTLPRSVSALLHTRSLHLVLAADVVWLDELVGPLVNTFVRLTERHRGAAVLMSYQERSSHTTRLLLEELSRVPFSVERVPQAAHHPLFQAKEIHIYNITRQR